MAINTKKLLKQTVPDNKLILHHLPDDHPAHILTIPVDPDAISDSMGASFAENFPLSRSAPIFSYQNSGPRNVQVSFTLHRDLVREYNPELAEQGLDPVDLLIENIDALVLPDYDSANKIVNPPVVSLKIRDEIYIKGVVTGSTGVTYNLPIINYGKAGEPLYKYALVSISFGISEITPYSASILPQVGGKYRKSSGLSSSGASSVGSSSPSTSVGSGSSSRSGGSSGGGGSTRTMQTR